MNSKIKPDYDQNDPPESLERLSEMEQKASPGPWRQGRSCGSVVNDANISRHASDTIHFYGGAPVFESADQRDCEFIVALRNAARWLILRAGLVNAPVDPPRPNHCTCEGSLPFPICECGAIENDPPEWNTPDNVLPPPITEASCAQTAQEDAAWKGEAVDCECGAIENDPPEERDREFIELLRNSVRLARLANVSLVNAADLLEANLAIEVESHHDTRQERDQARAEVRDLKADLERAQERLHRRELQRDFALKQRDHYATLLCMRGGL